MDKKVYIPSTDTLYKMQDMGANVYGYLVAKAIESIVMYGINHPNTGIFKNAYKYLREDYDIAKAICRMYPSEIVYSDVIKNDVNFCTKLLDMNRNMKDNPLSGKYYLDYLSYFSNGVNDNVIVCSKVIDMLSQELSSNPRYRFEYRYSPLVYKILNGEITCQDVSNMLSLNKYSMEYDKNKKIATLASIEPSYGIILDGKREIVQEGVSKYILRYGLSYYNDYLEKDILTNPDEKVKRLIKCIKNRNK